jgi:hypothetical protein
MKFMFAVKTRGLKDLLSTKGIVNKDIKKADKKSLGMSIILHEQCL